MNNEPIYRFASQIILALCSVSIVLSGCSEDVEVYEEVANTSIAAAQAPDSFCDYVAEHMTEMSSVRYINCANEKITALEANINKARNKCDEIYRDYVGPPDKGYMLLKCDEEQGVGAMETSIIFLNEFKNIGSGDASCSDISSLYSYVISEWNMTRQFYLDFGLPEPYPEWSVFVNELVADYKKRLKCEKVTEKFLGIEY